jgi:hypothetical protein
MAAVTIPNAGTYDLLVDVGFLIDAFTLDDPVKGLLDSPDYVLNGTTSFASVASGTTDLNVRRGRQDPDDQFTVGTMTFTLNDTLADGVFNPFDDDPTNPYYDQAQGVPGLAPGRAVELIRYDNSNNPETIFTGFIVNYEYTFRLGGLDTVTVFCADNMYRLASTGIEAQNPTKEFTGDRIEWVLDLPEVDYPTGAARNIATGTVELGGSGQYAISQGTNVKQYFDQITYSAERGRIFIDREGVLVSQNRIGNTLSSPVVTFSDQGGTDVPYNDLKIDFKADEIINLVEVQTRGSHVGSASDAGSQTTYFIKSLFINDSLLESNTAAQDLADYLLEPEPTPRFTAVQSWFGSLTTAQRDDVAILDIGDTVLIQKDILIGGVPTLRGEELAIEGVEHRIGTATGHTVRVYTSPTTIVYELILDDANDGILDTNVLG